MKNLGLEHPKRIDEALPANQLCGQVQAAESTMNDNWAPLRRTFAGIDEIDPEWVAAHRDSVQVVDVRESDEFNGSLGHIENAVLIPLGQLPVQLEKIEPSQPIVAVCRSGGRSAQAFVLLKRAGYDRVANLTGGMIHWHEYGLPVIRKP
jgi:rhodanese-related sulfurtransferase